jgi:ubiquitin carboxyl-terminal hydrolase 25/28
VNDNKSLQDQANQAARIIAQSRNSHFLSSWIDSGFGNTMDQIMDPAEGYQILQIQHREIEDEMIIMQYDSLVDEYPANAENYYKALTAIANGRASSVLLDHLHSKAPQLPVGTLEEPVGLENIGNTCYLNSLLQFFFTMVELRQIVLDFDRYKMSLEVDDIERKRVGHRKVSLKEVETAQKCTFENLLPKQSANPYSRR